MSSAGLLVSDDLFFSSRITGTAERLGLTLEQVATPAAAAARLRVQPFGWILYDLGCRGGKLEELFATSDSERPPVIAFGAHVATALLESARAAGCAAVLTRGKFDRELPEILTRLAAGDQISGLTPG